MRVREFDTNIGELKTWKRVGYSDDEVDKLVLAEGGKVAPLLRSKV